jgi:hypothetical protein
MLSPHASATLRCGESSTAGRYSLPRRLLILEGLISVDLPGFHRIELARDPGTERARCLILMMVAGTRRHGPTFAGAMAGIAQNIA